MKLFIRSFVCAGLLAGWAQAQTIRIASVGPLTGPQAGPGELTKWGVQLAIEEAQPAFDQLGLKLELVAQDDEATPDTGVAVAKRLVGDPAVLAVIGHLNSGVGRLQVREPGPGLARQYGHAPDRSALSEREPHLRAG